MYLMLNVRLGFVPSLIAHKRKVFFTMLIGKIGQKMKTNVLLNANLA